MTHNNVAQAIIDFLTGKHAVITSYISILAVTQDKFDKVSVSIYLLNKTILSGTL